MRRLFKRPMTILLTVFLCSCGQIKIFRAGEPGFAGKRTVPETVFRLTEAEFRELSGGDVSLLPGFKTCFAPQVETAVLAGMHERVMERLQLKGNRAIARFRRTTVQKILPGKGPGFAAVTFADGEVIEKSNP